MRQIFLDCDGVLADMDTYYEQLFGEKVDRANQTTEGKSRFWRNIHLYNQEEHQDFYAELPVMPEAHDLVAGVRRFCETPIILTGGDNKKASKIVSGKLRWRDIHFPGLEMIVCLSKEKSKFGKPGDILIDDWLKYRHLWEEMGGVFVVHTKVTKSLAGVELAYEILGD